MDFENNILLLATSCLVAVILWVASNRIRRWRVRRMAKMTIAFLVFPVVYIGHPILFYQVWMLVLSYVENQKIPYILGAACIWILGLSLSQLWPPKKDSVSD